MKELSNSHKMSIQMNDDRYAKKCKELEVILKDKKCRNCPICMEGMNLEFKDQIDLITDLNKKIFEQSQANEKLHNEMNVANKLISDISSNNFKMLRQKT